MNTNPIEVLRLDPSASEEEIVHQAGRLRQRAADEATRNAIRQAVQALTASTEARQRFALLTHAAPDHHLPPALQQFTAAFRRPLAQTNGSCPQLDKDEFKFLLCALIAEELELSPLPFEPLAIGESPTEIDRQTQEALWQNLLFDPGA